jgi:CubicO group peptidase (beta-lactamase class C family)
MLPPNFFFANPTSVLASLMIAYLCAAQIAPPAVAQEYFPPPDSAGGWRQLHTPEDVQRLADMDLEALDAAFDYTCDTTANGGLVVVRNGWLVYERYFGLGHREATPNLASCGKSFTSVAIGILLAEHPELFPLGLDQQVFTPAFFPDTAFPLTDERRRDIKLGQLLSMTAGIRGNNPGYKLGNQEMLDPLGPDGWQAMVDETALGQRDETQNGRRVTTGDLWCEPGAGYSYSTSSIHLASIMLRQVSGMELEEYLDRHIARKTGWGKWGFGYKHARDLKHTPGGGGIAMRATDVARFGYLLLREGRWKDQQIIPSNYVKQCRQATTFNPHFPYSFQFNVNAGGYFEELPHDAFWKGGSGGHALYVVPSLDLVVWKLGGRDGQYMSSDTGIPRHPDTLQLRPAPLQLAQAISSDVAIVKTLHLVVAAVGHR